MTHDLYDIRIRVLQNLLNVSNKQAYLSGVLTGLKIQGRLMRENDRTSYSSAIVDFFNQFHIEPIAVLLNQFNTDKDSDGIKLVIDDFCGGSLVNTNQLDEYLEGMEEGLVYVTMLYHAFNNEGCNRKLSIHFALNYLLYVIEWFDEALNLRLHVHE